MVLIVGLKMVCCRIFFYFDAEVVTKNFFFIFMRHAVGDSTGAYFPSVG